MTDIQIPHEHLPALRRMREGSIIPSDMDLVDALIAAAKADAPEPPEMVLYRAKNDDEQMLYRQPDGWLTRWRNGDGVWFMPGEANYDDIISRCTPLVPTVNADGLEKAATRYYDEGSGEWEAGTTEALKSICRNHARAILRAAGVAVEGDETDGAS